jgi:hypothetical protein
MIIIVVIMVRGRLNRHSAVDLGGVQQPSSSASPGWHVFPRDSQPSEQARDCLPWYWPPACRLPARWALGRTGPGGGEVEVRMSSLRTVIASGSGAERPVHAGCARG